MTQKTMKQLVDKMTTPPMKRRLLTVHRAWLSSVAYYRQFKHGEGRLPDFIIIGAQKGGTTYLYGELVKHPDVAPALTKEVHFFDSAFDQGVGWYRSFFPAASTGEAQPDGGRLTGEASPCYLFHPHAARRIDALLPHVKLIVLLRNPVNRAYSHYHHEVRLGFETLSFEEAIEREAERLAGERDKMLVDERYQSYSYMHHSYLARGRYVEQLQVWRDIFPTEQLLIIKSEDFYRQTPVVMEQVCHFLGLSPQKLAALDAHERSGYAKLDASLRARLHAYFEPYNQELYDYLGADFGWGR